MHSRWSWRRLDSTSAAMERGSRELGPLRAVGDREEHEANMKKGTIGAALLTAVLFGHVSAAQAQSPPPQGAMPEPVPLGPACAVGQAPAVAGPLTPGLAPLGPGPDLSLPATIPTAWGPGLKPESYVYAHAGALSLRRQRPGHTVFAVRDTTVNLDLGTIPPTSRTQELLDYHSMIPDFGWGVTATVGYLYDNAALEVSGFWVPEADGSAAVAEPGRVMLFFRNPPIGLEGDNGMWLQADFARATIANTLGSLEMNYRWWSRPQIGFEGLVGVRYIDLQDKLTIFTDDDGITIRDINGMPDPLRQGIYFVRSHNRILGPQLGFEWFYPLTSFLNLNVTSKGTWGVNWIEAKTRVKRGDTYVGREGEDNDVSFSHAYEISSCFEFTFLEKMRVRAGYNVLWVLNVNEATRQVNYDLAEMPGPLRNNGSVFYHGPVIELQFLF
jgi:hypothetical protein